MPHAMQSQSYQMAGLNGTVSTNPVASPPAPRIPTARLLSRIATTSTSSVESAGPYPSRPSPPGPSPGPPSFFFLFLFIYSLLACDLWRSWREYVQSVSCPQSAQWRLAASTPFALRPGLSQERVDAPKENDKGKTQRKSAPRPPYSSPAAAIKSCG